MGKGFSVTVFDKSTNCEVTEGVGFVAMNDREHYGSKHITVLNGRGIPMNVGILRENGEVIPQPGYEIKVEKA